MTVDPMPLEIEDITPEWLSAALSGRFPGATVESATVDSTIFGTAVKVFLDLRYRDPAVEAPRRVCVKGGFRAELREIMSLGYQTEARFYRDFGTHLSEGLPEHYFADADESTGQGIVVMPDLTASGVTASGVRFGHPGTPLTVDQAADALGAQATWHARSAPEAVPWLTGPSNLHQVAQAVLTPENWAAHLDEEPSELILAAMADRDRFVRGMERTWEIEDGSPACLTHGDANLTNVYLTPDDHVHFVDWQFVSLSDWAHDVAFFLIGALDVADRREHEQDLLREYLDLRAKSGGPVPNWDDAWTSYRLHTLHGLMYAITPDEMQPAEIRRPLAERYAHALLDHESYRLLGV